MDWLQDGIEVATPTVRGSRKRSLWRPMAADGKRARTADMVRSTILCALTPSPALRRESEQSANRLWAIQQIISMGFMKSTAERFGENVSTLIPSRDVMNHHLTLGDDMTNPVVADINMLETIGGIMLTTEGNTARIILINGSRSSLRKSNLRQNLAKVAEFLDTLSQSVILSFRGTEGGRGLKFGVPGNRTTSKHDDEAGGRSTSFLCSTAGIIRVNIS